MTIPFQFFRLITERSFGYQLVGNATFSVDTFFFISGLLIVLLFLRTEKKKKRTRMKVHFSFALVFFLMVLLFKWMNDKLIIDFILKFAGITYGPLLGLFAFGILTKRKLNEKLIWTVCILAPLLALGIDMLSNPAWYEAKLHMQLGLKNISESIFHGYKIGNELILINGIFTFLGLWMISKRPSAEPEQLQAA